MAELRKFGYWVFSMDYCPQAATAAVLNKNGTFAFWCGTHPEDIKIDPSRGCWNAAGKARGTWQHAGFNRKISSEGWDHSLIFKGPFKNKLSASVIRMDD